MPLEIKDLYEFGDFRLDIKEKVLMRGEEQIPLTPKVFEIGRCVGGIKESPALG